MRDLVGRFEELAHSFASRICYIPPSGSTIEVLHCGRMSTLPSLESARGFDLLSLSPANIKRLRAPKIDLKTVYISHLDPLDGTLEVARRQPHETIHFILLRRARDALSALGYTADLRGPDLAHPTAHWLTLSDGACTITIEYQHTLSKNGRQLTMTIEANLRMAARGRPPDYPSASGREAQAAGSRSRRVVWDDTCPWHQAASAGARTKQVMLSSPTGWPKPLTLNLGLAFAAKVHYSVQVEVLQDSTLMTAMPSGSLSLSQQLTWVGKRGSDAVRDCWRGAAERRNTSTGGRRLEVDSQDDDRSGSSKGG
ncbi:hypothetical protein V8D89_003107 [Ganoderma adspersum]